MSFEQSSIIISGGSKGIGLAIARVFARNTSRPLVLIARSQNDLEEARKLCLADGAKTVSVIDADLTKAEEISSIDFSKFNPGILLNNAGSFLFKKLEHTSPEEFEGQFLINTMAAFNLTTASLPALLKQPRALIVNISSMSALKGMASSGAYVMSKHALLGYTRSLRKELRKSNIAVTAINLGQTYSTSWEGVDIDPKRLINPDDVGRLILALSEMTPQTVAEEINLMPQGGEMPPM